MTKDLKQKKDLVNFSTTKSSSISSHENQNTVLLHSKCIDELINCFVLFLRMKNDADLKHNAANLFVLNVEKLLLKYYD